MNKAISDYRKGWFPEEEDTGEPPCVLELPDDEEEQSKDTANADTENHLCLVTCEDYGQSIAIPSYRANRPNIDYFQSDLHIHMFNVCNTGDHSNAIYLYDERNYGKDGNTVCSLRYKYHTDLIKKRCDEGKPIPKLMIAIRDNCVGQKKSQQTMMFDALLSLLFYERVAVFFLLPGHSHMRADQVVSLCKRSLHKKDLFIPEQVCEAMSSVDNMFPQIRSSQNKIMCFSSGQIS